jgi:hypothetical protein
MVNKKSITYIALSATIFFSLISILVSCGVKAQSIQYHLNHEYAKIWINQDGTIDLLYDIKITCDQGTINYVNMGQPNGDFTIGEAKDKENRTLQTADVSEGNNYRARVYLYTPISTTESIQFTLLTNVGYMIWEDEENPGNVGMQFIPCWWDDAEVHELRVSVVLPSNVTKHVVKCVPDWNGTDIEDGRLVLYWERNDLQPGDRFPRDTDDLSYCGVSFPEEYVEHYFVPERGVVAFLKNYGVWIGVFVFFVCIVGGIVYVVRKGNYVKPVMRMETLGIRRGLTAVEASYLLGLKPTKIVTAILYSLLKKRAVWATSTKPSVKLKIVKEREKPLRYYENTFLKAIKKDGNLSEEKLGRTIMELREEVEEKLRGYCRRDTMKYYEKIVAKAWEQVEQAGTAQLASKAYDEQLLWLLLDENFESRTENTFQTRGFEPEPLWFWYWYGYHYQPQPEYKPTTTPPSGPTVPPKIPGADFANNIATAVEGTANNIVVNLEKFANAIIPAPPPSQKTSRQPAHHRSSCACACAACACVCACVSCACACASGGVGS